MNSTAISPKTTNSTTLVSYPIIAALVAAEAELGPKRQWTATSPKQEQFLATIFDPSRDEIANIPEIESTSSRSSNVINEFLRARGFSIQLQPFTRPGDFGVASILKLALQWVTKGKITQVEAEGKQYPAVKMDARNIGFYKAPDHPHPVVVIQTQSGDEVGLTMSTGLLTEDELAETAERIFHNLEYSREEFSGVTFPMVDLDMQPDVRWLLGMNTMGEDGVPGVISQALQQTKFSMDEFGASVASAAAMAVSRSLSVPKHHVIDKPFIAVVSRGDLKQFIFTGYIAEDCWKKPAR